MPDKQLVFTIPEHNKDGTCRYDCPFNKSDDRYVISSICCLNFHRMENWNIYPDKGCPQSKRKE